MIENPSPKNISVENFKELFTELDFEKQAHVAVENLKSESQVSFNRLKAIVHGTIKKRDEFGRQRDETFVEKEEALKSHDKVLAALDEIEKAKDEIPKQ